MKFLVILLTVMPLVWGAEFREIAKEQSRSITNEVIAAIESFKEQMPCGFTKLGIPPLAPYKTAHQEIALDTSDIQTYGEITDFLLYGLNDFDIPNLKINAILSRATFKFNWRNVHFKTNYNVTSARNGKGLRRYGPAKFSVKNFTIWGVLRYKLGLLTGNLSVKELSVYASLGEVKSEIGGLSKYNIINKKLNRIIEEWLMIAVNDNTNNVAELTNRMVVPVLNGILSDKSLGDLMGMIGGGSDPNEKEPCLPPNDLY